MLNFAIGSDDSQVKRKDLWAQYQIYQANSQNNRTQETDKIGAYLNGSLEAGAYKS